MARDDTVGRFERKATAAPYQDGIIELCATAVFLGVALLWLAGHGELMALLALPIVFGAGAALAWAKRRVTYPRIGYAEPKQPGDRSPWSAIAFIAGGLLLMIGAVVVFGDISDATAWRRWAPFLAGFLCSGGFWYLADVSGLWRYRLIAAFSIVLGLVISLGSDGATYVPVALYAAIMAAVLAVVGVVTLVLFLARHPKQARTPSVEA